MSESRFRTLVVVLLALNVFILCSVAGGAIAWIVSSRHIATRPLPLAAEFLPEHTRTAFQHALAATRRANHKTVVDAQQARIDAAALIGKDTLDPVALNAALARAREDDITVRAAIEQRAVEFAATLPVDQRHRLSEGLMQRMAPKPAK